MVFDFDGTIADSLAAVTKIGNRLAPEFGLAPIKDNEVEKLRGKSSREIFKTLNISIYKVPFILKKVRKEFSGEIENLKPIDGISKALFALKKRGIILAILTSNSQENVQKFLKKNKLAIFDFIYSGSSIFGKDKVIKKMILEKQLDLTRTIYIGDETRDIEACKKCHLRVAAVSWGINNYKILESHKPDWLIDHPSQLLDIIF